MVDAINNNRDAVYTGIGAAAGLAAGGAYGGWLSKPLLKGDAPSDAFVKRYYDNSMKDAAEAAKKALVESDAYKTAGDDVTKLKEIIKNDPAKFGVKAEEGKTIDDAINAFAGENPKGADLKAKMEKAVGENAIAGKKSGKELTKLKQAFDKLGDNFDNDAAKKFAKEHAEILGLDETTASSIEAKALKTKFEAATANLTAKANELKGIIKDKKLDLKSESVTDAMKKAAKETKLWAGAKWAAIGAAALGICSYIGAKMTAPKAPAETPSENA